MCHLMQHAPLFTNEKRTCAPDSDSTTGRQAAGVKVPWEHRGLHPGGLLAGTAWPASSRWADVAFTAQIPLGRSLNPRTGRCLPTGAGPPTPLRGGRGSAWASVGSAVVTRGHSAPSRLTVPRLPSLAWASCSCACSTSGLLAKTQVGCSTAPCLAWVWKIWRGQGQRTSALLLPACFSSPSSMSKLRSRLRRSPADPCPGRVLSASGLPIPAPATLNPSSGNGFVSSPDCNPKRKRRGLFWSQSRPQHRAAAGKAPE